jgi:hypothetical protein
LRPRPDRPQFYQREADRFSGLPPRWKARFSSFAKNEKSTFCKCKDIQERTFCKGISESYCSIYAPPTMRGKRPQLCVGAPPTMRGESRKRPQLCVGAPPTMRGGWSKPLNQRGYVNHQAPPTMRGETVASEAVSARLSATNSALGMGGERPQLGGAKMLICRVLGVQRP